MWFLCPCDKESGGILIYPCPSVRIQIHGLSSYLLLQFWSYSFNILQDVYTHNGGVHIHRISIFIKYSQNDRQLDLVILFVRPHIDTCLAISSYSFGATALIFCMMFIHIKWRCACPQDFDFHQIFDNDRQLDLVNFLQPCD